MKTFARIFTILTACVAMTACSRDARPLDATDEPDTHGVKLRMTISAGRDAVNAAGDLAYGLDFENEIKLNSGQFRFLIYHGLQNDSDARCIFDSGTYKSNGLDNLDNKVFDLYGTPQSGYHIIIDVAYLDFGSVADRPTRHEPVPLTMVCLANIKSGKASTSSSNEIWLMTPDGSPADYSTLGKVLAERLPYEMSSGWYPGKGGTSSKIPMFGMISTTLPPGMLYNGVKYPVIDIDETIWLLRPVAKIMLIDALTADADGFPRIPLNNKYNDGTSIPRTDNIRTADNFLTTGVMIPLHFQNHLQVTTPTLSGIDSASSLRVLTQLADKTDITVNGVTRSLPYIPFYCAEQPLGLDVNAKKIIYIPVEYAPQKIEMCPIALDDLPVFEGKILRNHIYRLAVTKFTHRAPSRAAEPVPGALTVSAEVTPMR